MNTQFKVAYVRRASIDRLLMGELEGEFRPFLQMADLKPPYLKEDEIVAVYRESSGLSEDLRKPCLLSIPSGHIRDLLAWTTTYQAEFSPISQWCRVIDSEWVEIGRDNFNFEATLDGLEAAWAGAVIGEIMARRGVDLSEISLVWCLSSGTFAFARAIALWHDKATPDKFLGYINEARKLLQAEPRRELEGLSDIWRVLLALQNPTSKVGTSLYGTQKAIFAVCQEIRETGRFGGANAVLLSEYCSSAQEIAELDKINAEDRVRLIDSILPLADKAFEDGDSDALDVISFLLGYAIGRVGAGESNLELLLPFNAKLPMAAIWCPVIAGLHRPIAWSSALNGLGRLVVRELTQTLHLDDAPKSDICLEELRVIINPKVKMKRLPFKSASSRVVTVELIPGVNLAVNLSGEWSSQPKKAIAAEYILPEMAGKFEALKTDILRVLQMHSADLGIQKKPTTAVNSKPRSRTSSKKRKSPAKKRNQRKLL